MPPRGKALPDAGRQTAFVEGLARSIVSAERAELAGEGRAIRRPAFCVPGAVSLTVESPART